MKLLKKLNSPWFIAVVCAVGILVINWPSFFLYWYSPFIQGWDGQGHASIGQHYAEHIFPSVWGWVHNWYTGMPFPQFYPPLFYFIMAGLYHILPFSYITLFKIFVTILQLSVPAVTIFFVYKRVRSSWSVWISGIFSMLLVSSYFPKMESYGMNVSSTLNTGSVTQLLSFVFLILWLHFFLKIEHDRKARYLSCIFLLLTLISNVHNCIVVFFIFLTTFVISALSSREKIFFALSKKFGLYFINGLIPLLMTAFWTLPLFHNYKYFVTIFPSYPPLIGNLFIFAGIIPVGLFIFLVLAFYKKNRDAYVISTCGAVVFGFIYLFTEFDQTALPIHVNRWFGVLLFSLPILLGILFEDISDIFKMVRYKVLVFASLILIIFFATGNYALQSQSGYYLQYEQDNFGDMVEFFKTNSEKIGIVMIESTEQSTNTSMSKLDSILGQYSEGASTFILRESSINSIFMTPVRNSLSYEDEGWGFRSYIVFDKDFKYQDKSKSLDRAWNTGVQSFLIRSKYMKNQLALDPRIVSIKNFGGWELFSFKDRAQRADILKNRPVAFYGNAVFKERDIADYDWARFQEELMFSNKKDITLFYANDQYLDSSEELLMASTTIISEYMWHNESAALKRLLEYSKKNELILVAQFNSLFYELQRIAKYTGENKKYNVKIIDRLTSTPLNPNPLRKQLSQLYDGIKKTGPGSEVVIDRTVVSDHKILVELSSTSTEPLPVLIKSSYFPAWERSDGASIYLASPGFILTFATSTFELNFTTPSYVKIGWVISISTLLIFSALSYFHIFRRKD